MDLTEIARRVYGKEYFEGPTSRIICKTNKKIFLIEAGEWMQEIFNDLATQSAMSLPDRNPSAVSPSIDSTDRDTRLGRIGSNNVYFTLDRSFGIVAINQEGLNVVAACRFASVSASCGVYQGKWMYELHLGSKGIMQIGWCTNLCGFTIDRGCGDTQNSYAFDGSRIKSWNMLSRQYGELWKTGDVIGICINLDEANIEFYRNGRSMGIAFKNIATGAGIIYLPCVSLVEGESVYANFGARPFRYPNTKYEPLQQKPLSKISQAEYLFRWLKNLTNLATPTEPNIKDCNVTGDISDTLFWNRFYSSMCYHLNSIIMNRYCLFNNFIPFIVDICEIKDGKQMVILEKFIRVMDEMWMYVKERHMEKALFISRVQYNLDLCATDYNLMYLQCKLLKKKRPKNDPLVKNLEISIELQKEDLTKRARKNAWIEHVLLSSGRFQHFIKMFEILINTVSALEKQGDLFVFLPDFYFDACDVFTEVLLKDFNNFTFNNDEVEELLRRMAEIMIHLVADERIKHIDCKKIPMNILASYTTSPGAMKILESVSKNRAVELMDKLMVPYTDRHWKASNWILVRFWHGSGFGFRYTNLPHHNITMQQLSNQSNYIMYNIVCSPSPFYQNLVRDKLLDVNSSIPALLDSIISELHWTFGEFLTPMQELQRAIERNEQLLMMGRLYKMCSTFFDKTIGLLRVLDMFIVTAPEVFLESYYPESTAFTRRIIQVVLLIIHRISSKHGCFRIVMNSRIAVLENVEYFPLESACVAILLGILHQEMERYSEDDISIPLFCRMVLTDPSYDYDNLNSLIGTPENRNNTVVSLYDYEDEVMSEVELSDARNMLKMLEIFLPKLSTAKVIPEDELCTICYSAPFDVKFYPCGHNSCLSCISYYLTKNRQCFFCKQPIIKVIRIADNTVIDSLTDREA